jgi:hypothetical protein
MPITSQMHKAEIVDFSLLARLCLHALGLTLDNASVYRNTEASMEGATLSVPSIRRIIRENRHADPSLFSLNPASESITTPGIAKATVDTSYQTRCVVDTASLRTIMNLRTGYPLAGSIIMISTCTDTGADASLDGLEHSTGHSTSLELDTTTVFLAISISAISLALDTGGMLLVQKPEKAHVQGS